jgi:hypothetical protein
MKSSGLFGLLFVDRHEEFVTDLSDSDPPPRL